MGKAALWLQEQNPGRPLGFWPDHRRRDRGPFNKMGILTYQACWDQRRQRRGPCPGEPLRRTELTLDWKSSHIQKREELSFRPQSNRLNRDTGPQSSPCEKQRKQSTKQQHHVLSILSPARHFPMRVSHILCTSMPTFPSSSGFFPYLSKSAGNLP